MTDPWTSERRPETHNARFPEIGEVIFRRRIRRLPQRFLEIAEVMTQRVFTPIPSEKGKEKTNKGKVILRKRIAGLPQRFLDIGKVIARGAYLGTPRFAYLQSAPHDPFLEL